MKPRYLILLPDKPECRKCGMFHEAKGKFGRKTETWGMQCGATKKIIHSKSYEAMEEELHQQCPIIQIRPNDRIEGYI